MLSLYVLIIFYRCKYDNTVSLCPLVEDASRWVEQLLFIDLSLCVASRYYYQNSKENKYKEVVDQK